MWNRSYRWQQKVRLLTGAVVLAAVGGGLLALAGTAAARRAGAGAVDLAREVGSAADRTIDVAVPENLNPRVGTLVYRERPDGVAQVIGRVVKVAPAADRQVTIAVRLTAPADELGAGGGILRGMPATLDLRTALAVLVSPETIETEMARARDKIWPTLASDVLPNLIDALLRETIHEFSDPPREDAELFARSLESLRATLEPLEEELLDRLAKRAWEVVGIPGIAAGIWRTTSDEVQNRSLVFSDWWRNVLGRDEKSPETVDRPFLSDEKSALLQTALEQEALAFWNEHRTVIADALTKFAAERRPEFEAAFRDRWGATLYERAILPAWQQGQDQVLAAVQDYALDFTMRRLLTEEGGPRLMLAFALRSSLDISDDPLLIYAPVLGKAGGIVYEPLVP